MAARVCGSADGETVPIGAVPATRDGFGNLPGPLPAAARPLTAGLRARVRLELTCVFTFAGRSAGPWDSSAGVAPIQSLLAAETMLILRRSLWHCALLLVALQKLYFFFFFLLFFYCVWQAPLPTHCRRLSSGSKPRW